MPNSFQRPDFRADFARPELDPRAAYPAGTGMTSLRTAEALMVVALRLWTAHRLEPDAGHPDWRDGFLAADLCGVGVACFQSFLGILETAAKRPVTLGRPRDRMLTDDEARLLCVIRSLQSERGHDATALLADWLPPAAARIALDYVCGLATALCEARLVLPAREGASQPTLERRFIHRADLSVVH
ncbi:MAG TPA: hypothetical protein VFS04_04595 [Alphaproteobacteria bacterium]|nr:hypothetical protein [Alphaproteobacteria bacterium]